MRRRSKSDESAFSSKEIFTSNIGYQGSAFVSIRLPEERREPAAKVCLTGCIYYSHRVRVGSRLLAQCDGIPPVRPASRRLATYEPKATLSFEPMAMKIFPITSLPSSRDKTGCGISPEDSYSKAPNFHTSELAKRLLGKTR